MSQGPSRRTLIAGGGALGAVAWLGLHAVGHRPMSEVSSRFLGSAPLRTLIAAFEVLLPDPARAEPIARELDAYLAGSDPLPAAELRMALTLIEHAGGIGLLPRTRFSRQAVEAREATLREWEGSRLALKRQVFQALRRAAVFSFYADPSTWSHVGYDGPWVSR